MTFQLIQKGALKNFFKALFINTPVITALKKMSTAKSTPEGLKPQECERSSGWSKPPIPYMSKRDAVQKSLAVDNTANTMKLTLPGNVELRVSEKMYVPARKPVPRMMASDVRNSRPLRARVILSESRNTVVILRDA